MDSNANAMMALGGVPDGSKGDGQQQPQQQPGLPPNLPQFFNAQAQGLPGLGAPAPQQQQGGGALPPNLQFLSMQGGMGAGAPGGLPNNNGNNNGSGNFPLLVGASPLQQQISALQNSLGGGAAQPNLFQFQQNQMNPLFNLQQQQLQQQQGMPQQQHQPEQQQQQLQMPGQHNNMQGQMNMMTAPNVGASLQQQIQQLQFAQQLISAGMPVNLNLGGTIVPMQQPQQMPQTVMPPQAMPALQQNMLQPSMDANPTALSPHVQAPPANKSSKDEWSEPFAGKGKKEPPFPLKLHQILSNPEFQECICWNPHGRSWRILKPPVFEQLVIPLYFRHAKYASFMRQVNGWGFKRIVSGNDHNSYYHEMFVRDMPQLCLKMKRIKKGETKKDDGSDEPPNFDAALPAGEPTVNAAPPPAPTPAASVMPSLQGMPAPPSMPPGSVGVANNPLTNLLNQQGLNLGNLQPGLAPAPPPPAASFNMLQGVDQSTILKLQEALSGQSAQPLQQPQPNASPGLSFLSPPGNSSQLAAQLQAATQGPTDGGLSAHLHGLTQGMMGSNGHDDDGDDDDEGAHDEDSDDLDDDDDGAV